MNIAHYRKAIVSVLPSLVSLGLVVLQHRLGIEFTSEEQQILYILLGVATAGTTGALVYQTPNAPKK